MFDLFQEIYTTIKNNKLRTFLTGFAVAWGIFILIVLLGAGNGLLNAFEGQMGQFNSSSIRIYGGQTSEPHKGYQRGRQIRFTDADVQLLLSTLDEYIYNGGGSLSMSSTVSTPKDYIQGNINAIYPNYQQTEALEITQGRFINQADIQAKRKVIVLSEEVVQTLFDTPNPIGDYVIIDNISYRLIGIYKGGGFRDDQTVYVPFHTFELIYNKDKLGSMTFQLSDKVQTEQDNEEIEEKIRAALSQAHEFNPTDQSSIWIWNRLKQYLQQQDASSYLKIAIWVIGIFTLLSGIVGVSNIMLITVKERTKEFGIRKAIGAKPLSILTLVLTESIVITTLFGYVGMLCGIAATEWMDKVGGDKVMDMGAFSQTVFTNPTVDIQIAIQATITLIIAGTIAGFIPARKAVKVKPVDALNAR